MRSTWTILIASAAILAGCAGTTFETRSIKKDDKVKIFILSGQSNMTGRGVVKHAKVPFEKQHRCTLAGYVQLPENLEKLAYLRNGKAKTEDGWTIRDDVFITVGTWPHPKQGEDGFDPYRKHGGLSPYFGSRKNGGFGPELAIGNILGDHYDQPVVLIKVSFGGNSLGKHFRPPSSGGEQGIRYQMVLDAVKEGIEHLPYLVPGYTAERGYELVGLFWNQGLSDVNPEFSKEYETNLANLIKDLRKDLKAPGLKTVVAVSGNWGWGDKHIKESHARHREKHPTFTEEQGQERIDCLHRVQNAQLAISKRPEFAGNVVSAETRDFWRPRETYGGHGTEEHWMANAESYWLIGESMGNAMLKLLK